MNCKPQTEQNQDKAVQLAVRILQYSRNELLVALRFMDMALCKLEYQAADVLLDLMHCGSFSIFHSLFPGCEKR